MNRAIVILLKRNNRVVKTILLFSQRMVYSANIGGIIDDSLLEAKRAIVLYLRNGEWTHEF